MCHFPSPALKASTTLAHTGQGPTAIVVTGTDVRMWKLSAQPPWYPALVAAKSIRKIGTVVPSSISVLSSKVGERPE